MFILCLTIQDILESLCRAAVFSSQDLNSGYWQVEMDPGARDKQLLSVLIAYFNSKLCPLDWKMLPPPSSTWWKQCWGGWKERSALSTSTISLFTHRHSNSSSMMSTPCWMNSEKQDLQSIWRKLRSSGLLSSFWDTWGHLLVSMLTMRRQRQSEISLYPPTLRVFLAWKSGNHCFVPNFSQNAELSTWSSVGLTLKDLPTSLFRQCRRHNRRTLSARFTTRSSWNCTGLYSYFIRTYTNKPGALWPLLFQLFH